MRDPYPPVSEETRDYAEALMGIADVNSGILDEFLAITADPEWECKVYYSTTHLTALMRPAKGELWQRVECRYPPIKFAGVVLAARACGIPVKQMIKAQLASRAYNVL